MSASEPAKSYLKESPAWASAITAWLPERIAPVRRAGYTLKDLARRGVLDPEVVTRFTQETGLADFGWRALWADSDGGPDAETAARAVSEAAAVVILVHGWTGSGEIWEDLPALLVRAHPDLLVLVPDVNGFGKTPFESMNPSLGQVTPPAIMASLEKWLALIGLRGPSVVQKRPFVFVGHSMGGAALFYASPVQWTAGEIGRLAVAPALWMNDRTRQRLYRTMGAGILMGGWNAFTDWVAANVFVPRVIQLLAGASSARVHNVHEQMYRHTPEGVVSQTLAGLGVLEARFEQDQWPHLRVILGSRDAMVGVQPVLELLEQIGLRSEDVQIAFGDHYFFSTGPQPGNPARNRDLLLEEIARLRQALIEELNRPAAVVPPPPPAVKRPTRPETLDQHRQVTRRLGSAPADKPSADKQREPGDKKGEAST